MMSTLDSVRSPNDDPCFLTCLLPCFWGTLIPIPLGFFCIFLQFLIPEDDTTYACTFLPLPIVSKKHHIYKVCEPREKVYQSREGIVAKQWAC